MTGSQMPSQDRSEQGDVHATASLVIRPVIFPADLSDLRSFMKEKDAIRVDACRPAVNERDAFVLVAERKDAVVGLVIVDLRFRTDMGADPDDEGMRYLGGRNAYLENIEVRADLRNRGIGSKLLRAAEEEARMRGKRQLWLHADEKNVAAHRFWERNGWTNEKTVYPLWKKGSPTRVYKREV